MISGLEIAIWISIYRFRGFKSIYRNSPTARFLAICPVFVQSRVDRGICFGGFAETAFSGELLFPVMDQFLLDDIGLSGL
jgi:hypothetical protein